MDWTWRYHWVATKITILDLPPFDYLKSKVYVTKPDNFGDLKNRIRTEIQNISYQVSNIVEQEF